MKKLTFILTLLVIFSSCSEESKVKNKAEKLIKENMDDPKSYEFASFGKDGTLTWNDCIDARIRIFQSSLDWHLSRKDKQDVKYYKALIAGMEWIRSNLGEKAEDVAITNYVLKVRGKNKLGATVLNEFYVQVLNDGKAEILNLASERDKMYNTLTEELPGYQSVLDECEKIKP